MKKRNIIATLALTLSLLPYRHATAAGVLEFLINKDIPPTKEDVETMIENLVNFGLSIAGILAVLFIIINGLKLITSGGNKDNIESAKSGLTAAIIGLTLIALTKVIVAIFITSINNIL